ncbi:RagB/SusD family nutrient uptake outer membrane protein [Chryseobacterium profundimaris]|uniref:Starch-binding associating with outer membrane n=1 Tax=Chryseobacterium profundimaris TaxID=1387275 RepID=A0ABY1NEB1_9FLAO|nr:RagB/SusD family nutrient uptake outer membrane protein [Chryseobacterium profundimaris]SMP07571.1 Starch-binding associating with outer membrane [Chryseobacterium profundimaris]
MKKIFYILSVFLVMTSCNDALDIVQDGEINDEMTAFQSVNDMKLFLNGNVYPAIDPLSEISFTSIFTDEVGFGPAGVSTTDIQTHRWVLNSTTGDVAGIWVSNYNIINKVNILLEGSKLINYDNLNDEEKLLYTAIVVHARAIRAYAYITLESYFSTDMKDPNALGVMLSTEPANILETKLPRVKNSEVFALIESDLQYALTNFSATSVSAGGNFLLGQHYLQKPAIHAIAARYYNYRGDNTNAKVNATTAITTSGLTLQPASAGTGYLTMWQDITRGEILWSLSRPNSAVGAWSNIAGLFTTNSTDIDGSVNFDMSRRLYALINDQLPGEDIRRDAFVDGSSRIDEDFYPNSANPREDDVIVINKYPGKTPANVAATTQLRNDIKMFRLSEMYFILAEVAVREGDLATAATRIRTIRGNRSKGGLAATITYTSPQQAYADILLERRRELCYEGHRYLDLKRMGVAAGAGIDRDKYDDDNQTLPLTLPASDYRFRSLPIPLDEINANPNVQQNPGYN